MAVCDGLSDSKHSANRKSENNVAFMEFSFFLLRMDAV